jgi:hypothetical protein
MGLRYLTFMGRNLQKKNKLLLVQIMNNFGMNSKNIVNNISIFNDNVFMNSIFCDE